MHTYIRTNVQIRVHSDIDTYTHTYGHTCVHRVNPPKLGPKPEDLDWGLSKEVGGAREEESACHSARISTYTFLVMPFVPGTGRGTREWTRTATRLILEARRACSVSVTSLRSRVRLAWPVIPGQADVTSEARLFCSVAR